MKNVHIKLHLLLIIFIAACSPSVEESVDRAIALQDKGKYREAIAPYSDIIKDDDKLQVPIYNRGICYMALKDYKKALEDFNNIVAIHEVGRFVMHYNANSPFASKEARAQVPYLEAVYQRAQTLYEMDSLKSALLDFDRLVEEDFEKSNCLGWQGSIWIKAGDKNKACHFFAEAKKYAENKADSAEADKFIDDYCNK